MGLRTPQLAPFGQTIHRYDDLRDEEAKWLRQIQSFLNAHIGRILERSGQVLGVPDELFWGEEEALLTILARDLLGSTINVGGLFAIGDLQRRYRIGVDWALVNTDAQEWATKYAATLAKGLTETTLAQVRQVIGDWIASGEPLPRLAIRLREQAGIERRAQLIAQTESTRAFVEGNRIAWEKSGVVAREEWQTAVDERVCPVCLPLNTKQNQKLGGPFAGGYRPPAHVGCRCALAPVVRGTE